MQELLMLLSSGSIKPSQVVKEIPDGFFDEKLNRYAMMKYFDDIAGLEHQKEEWKMRADADQIAQILQKNTLAHGHGLFKLQKIGALSDVLTDESLEAIDAFKEMLKVMFEAKGVEDFNFWIQFSHRYRDCRLKEIFWPTLMSLGFSDEQKARLLAKRKYLVYMPEEKRTPVFMNAFDVIAGAPTKRERKAKKGSD